MEDNSMEQQNDTIKDYGEEDKGKQYPLTPNEEADDASFGTE